MGAILFSVNWDPLTLGYSGIKDLFDNGVPEPTIGTYQANKGKVIFLWTSPDPLDNEFDFTRSFLVTFRFRKNISGPAYVFLTMTRQVIEIADLDNNPLSVDQNGELRGGIMNGKVCWDANEDCQFILEKDSIHRMVELTDVKPGNSIGA